MMKDSHAETYQDGDAEYLFAPFLEGRFSKDDLLLTRWEHDPYPGCGAGGPLLRRLIPMSREEVEEQRRPLTARRDRAYALYQAMDHAARLVDEEIEALEEDEDAEDASIDDARRRHETLGAMTYAAERVWEETEHALGEFEEKVSATAEARALFDAWGPNGRHMPELDLLAPGERVLHPG